MQSLGMRRAVPVDHGIFSDPDAHGVDDQRVTLIMADGIAVPGWSQLCRMLRVHAHMADLRIVLIEDDDLVRGLQDLGWGIGEREWRPFEPALVVRVRIAHAQRALPVLSDDPRSLWLQNRIGVIALELEAVSGAVRAA